MIDTSILHIKAEIERLRREKAVVEKLLNDNVENYYKVINNIKDLLLKVDPERNIFFANSIVEHFLGYTLLDVVGIPLCSIVDDQDAESVLRLLDHAMDPALQGRDLSVESRIIKNDGEHRWVEMIATPYFDAEGAIICVDIIAHDITSRKMIENGLRDQGKYLEEQLNIRTDRLRKINDLLLQQIQERKRIEKELLDRTASLQIDLQAAMVVQKAFLPEIPTSGILKIDYRYQPYIEVGGDFLSIKKLSEAADLVGIFLGDVTGHGVAAALFTALVKSITDRVWRRHGLNPSLYLKELNGELIDEISDRLRYYITAIYGIFRPSSDNQGVTFSWAKGGHPYPVLLRKETGVAEFLKSTGAILGIFKETVFQEKSVHLHSGDRVFLYTDGIPETMNTDKELFGYSDAFLEVIANANHGSLSESLDYIIQSVNKFRGNVKLYDDSVIIGIEVI